MASDPAPCQPPPCCGAAPSKQDGAGGGGVCRIDGNLVSWRGRRWWRKGVEEEEEEEEGEEEDDGRRGSSIEPKMRKMRMRREGRGAVRLCLG